MKLQPLLPLLLLAGASACLLLFVFWQQRKAMRRFRRGMACDLHDEVGASLSNITLLIGLVSREMPLGQEGRAQEFLGRIGEEANRIHGFISDMLTVMDASCRKLGQLAALVNRHGYELLQEKGIGFSLTLPQALKETRIPASRRRHLYLIIKEALHNIMKHSGAGKVNVQFRADSCRLYCIIQDDGLGFDASGTHRGTGIGSMKRRAAAVKGRFEIVSSPGKGCTLQFSLPLKPWWHPAWLLRRNLEAVDMPVPQAEKTQKPQKQWEAQVH